MIKDKVRLPSVPDKMYFSIGEASVLSAVKPHVLRYWEEEFPALQPITRSGQRRYYQKKDISLIRKIRELLYEKGFTIAGARQYFQEEIKSISQPVEQQAKSSAAHSSKQIIREIIQELENLLQSCC